MPGSGSRLSNSSNYRGTGNVETFPKLSAVLALMSSFLPEKISRAKGIV
jgi:hypothetical protein